MPQAIVSKALELRNMKLCTRCRVAKDLTEFSLINRGRFGFRPKAWCKPCIREKDNSPEARAKQNVRIAALRASGQRKALDRKCNKTREQNHPEKIAAAVAVNSAIAAGKLIRPTVCSECGDAPAPRRNGRSAIEGHHDDYTKPLVVRWLCHSCHAQHHKGATA